MAPGPKLAEILAGIDLDEISGYDRVVVVQAWQRLRSWADAGFYQAVESVVEAEAEIFPHPMEAHAAAADEVRCALTMTRRSADIQILISGDLAGQPEVWQSLWAGQISLSKARTICEQIDHLDVAAARQVARIALERAPRQTTGQLAARLRKLVIEVDPDSAAHRYQEAVKERMVVLDGNDTGTANLRGLELPVAEANAAMRRIDHLARKAKTADDERTIDQVRADIFLDLLNGKPIDGSITTTDDGRGGVVHITVELETLAGLSEAPGEIEGYGPVVADIARQVAESQVGSEHRVTVLDHGEPMWTGTTRRRPTAAQRRQVEARNRVCVFPGCRRPAIGCDIDHTIPYSRGGPTAAWNNDPLCRHDHVGHHQRGWELKRIGPGLYEWTSPLGHVYIVGPDDR